MEFKNILLEYVSPEEARQHQKNLKKLNKINSKPSSQFSTAYNDIELPEETQRLINEGRWGEAYRTLTNANDIKAFTTKFTYEYKGLASFQEKVNKIRDALVLVLMQLGDKAYDDRTNPLLIFLKQFFSTEEFDNSNQFKFLVGLWSNGIVLDKNLKETDINKSILLNKDLYLKQNGEFIVQAYYWLGKEANVSPYLDLKNLDIRKKEDSINKVIGPQGRLPAGYRDENGKKGGQYDFKKVDYKAFRNLIIFVDMNMPSGPINDAIEIQARLKRLQDLTITQRELKGDKEDEGNNTKVKLTPKKVSRQEIEAIFKDGIDKMSKEKVNSLFNYFRDRGMI